jgi:glycosyltransferase involved in cell wall biosynthesis
MTSTSSVTSVAGGPPTVSVVIPTLNAARFACQAVESVHAQRNLPAACRLEIIVVDNGSTDGTPDLLRHTFGDRVRIVPETSSRGAAAARNAGISVAAGGLIATLDADDTWMPEKLALQLALLDARPDVSFVFCHGSEFADPAGCAPCREQSLPFPSASALLGRREAFAAAGPFPPFRSGEFIAWYGWTQSLGLVSHVLPQTLVRRRVHASNSTRDRTALEDYPLAIRWQLEKRRELEAGRPRRS